MTSWITGAAYAIEISGPTKRPIIGSFFQYWWGTGWAFSSLIGYLCPDWVDYIIVSSILTLILLPGLYQFPKSVPHLIQKGKYGEAMENLEKMANILEVEIPDEFKNRYTESEVSFEKVEKTRHSMLDMFRSRCTCRMIFMTATIFFCGTISYYGLSYNAVSLPGNLYDAVFRRVDNFVHNLAT